MPKYCQKCGKELPQSARGKYCQNCQGKSDSKVRTILAVASSVALLAVGTAVSATIGGKKL